MKLSYHNQVFIFSGGIADNALARAAGMQYCREWRKWVTPFASIAAKIVTLADTPTQALIYEKRQIEEAKVGLSSAVSSALPVPVAQGALFPYQRAGIEYMLETPRVLLADDMGLGKTAQAIGLCNIVRPQKVLIICPASLKINWAREWALWSTQDINPVIVNYDILVKNSIALHEHEYDMLILDECHYLKNDKAKRTREVFGHYQYGRWVVPPILASRVLALTGTPILNRPIELYPIIKYLLPSIVPNRMEYAKRYCSAFKNHFGWNMNGASNLAELQTKLRSTIMIRRLKEDVLFDLPAKVRQVIEINPNAKSKKALKRESKIFDFFDPSSDVLNEHDYRSVVDKMAHVSTPGFEGLSIVIKETALSKLDMCIDHLEEAILASRKVVCFCHHIEVAKELKKAFGKRAVMLIGSTSKKARQKAVDEFQSDVNINIFIGNIKSAGVGLTLTAASHVVFVELDWVPGNMTQAEDRCHRIGQKDSVLVQHLVLAGSLDYYMSKTIIHKQEVIGQAVDTEMSDELRELLS